MTMIMIRIQDTTSPKRGKVTIMTMMGSSMMRPMTQYRRLSYRLSNLRPSGAAMLRQRAETSNSKG